MDIYFIIEKLVLISAILGVSLVIAMYTTLAERKFAGFFQDRVGPNRAGPFGLLQPLADGVKLFTKEDHSLGSLEHEIDQRIITSKPLRWLAVRKWF